MAKQIRCQRDLWMDHAYKPSQRTLLVWVSDQTANILIITELLVSIHVLPLETEYKSLILHLLCTPALEKRNTERTGTN